MKEMKEMGDMKETRKMKEDAKNIPLPSSRRELTFPAPIHPPHATNSRPNSAGRKSIPGFAHAFWVVRVYSHLGKSFARPYLVGCDGGIPFGFRASILIWGRVSREHSCWDPSYASWAFHE